MNINETMAAFGSPYKIGPPERLKHLEDWLDAARVTPFEYLAHIKMIPADHDTLVPTYICAQKVRDGFLRHRQDRMAENAIRMDLQRRRIMNLLKDGRTLASIAEDHSESFCHLLRWLLLMSDKSELAPKRARAALFELKAQPELATHLLGWGFNEWRGYIEELKDERAIFQVHAASPDK